MRDDDATPQERRALIGHWIEMERYRASTDATRPFLQLAVLLVVLAFGGLVVAHLLRLPAQSGAIGLAQVIIACLSGALAAQARAYDVSAVFVPACLFSASFLIASIITLVAP